MSHRQRPRSRFLVGGGITIVLLTILILASTTTPGAAAAATSTDESPAPTPTSREQAGPVGEAWTLESAVVDATDGIKVLVLHDMEGLAGQDDWRTFDHGRPEYERGQELLAGDVNAVVDGLFAGGATEVVVVDGHGSGNPEPDLRADLLDPRAVQLLRDDPFDTYFDVPETTSGFDAVAVVGMHAKTGSGGFASHTYTLGTAFELDGRPITETELVALSWGRFGVPVVLASGDDRLGADLETMPWIRYVTVKTATSASTAELRPLDEARADLRDAARSAVEGLADARVMKVALPVRATLRVVPPASLAVLEGVPGIDYEEDAVSFTAGDLRAAYDGLEALVGVATTAYPRVLWEQLREMELGERVGDAYDTALTERWLDYESRRWAPPEPEKTDEDRKYHGYQ